MIINHEFTFSRIGGDMSQGLKKIHHVEFVVGNAKQAAFFYRQAFGFDQIADRGPETG